MPSSLRALAGSALFVNIARTGSYVLLTALAWRLTGSGTGVATVLLAYYLGGIAGTPLAGVLADRLPRRSVMIGGDLLALGVLGVLVLASDSLVGLLVCAPLLAAAEAVPALVARASVARLVPDDRLAAANSLMSFATTVGYSVGPFAAAALVVSVVAPAAILAAALLVSICLLTRLPPLPAVSERERGDPAWSLVRSSPVLLMLVANGLLMASYGLMVPAEIVLASELGDVELGYAALVCAWGAGSAVGALSARRLGDERLASAAFGGMLVTGTAFALVAVVPSLFLAVGCMAGGGAASERALIATVTRLQRIFPAEVSGRAFAAYDGITFVAFAACVPIGGVLVDAMGVRALYGLCAGAALVAGLVLVVGGRAPADTIVARERST